MKYDVLAEKSAIDKTAVALRGKGYEVFTVDDKSQALEKIKGLVPSGSSIMNGASETLKQIGYMDYLKSGTHSWNDLHKAITEEKDQLKRAILRKQATSSDFYVGSVHGLTEEGDFIIASNTGSQLPHVVFTSPNLIFVIGAQKIVPDLNEAFKRLEEYVVPLENENMKKLYGMGTMLSKIVVFKQENAMLGRKIKIIIVNEKLGF